MRLVDTHCHLDFPDYKDDLDDVIRRSSEGGVVRIISPGTSVVTSEKAVELSEKYPEVFASVGVHPHEADKAGDGDVARLRSLALESDKVVAIGEIGLDHYKGYSDPAAQYELFKKCLRLARELDLPAILHDREADKEVLAAIEETGVFQLQGVVHCFSGSEEFLEKAIARGLYVSFTGNITFEKAGRLRDLAGAVPPDRLLLETDGPFMPPDPLRGRRNEPANVRYLLDVYARIYGLSPEDVARITTVNADRLFRLGIKGTGTVVYPIRDTLYVNITHRCTNRCGFCTRNVSTFVKGHDLKLGKEPSTREMIDALSDISRYKEVTFCGLGEPTLRLGPLKRAAAYVKEQGGKTRLNTNGEGDLIAGRPIAPELRGLMDRVSVSVNARDKRSYDHICQSVFGEEAYGAIASFVSGCVKNGIQTEVTCLDSVGEDAVSAIRAMSEKCGAAFRLRKLHVVG